MHDSIRVDGSASRGGQNLKLALIDEYRCLCQVEPHLWDDEREHRVKAFAALPGDPATFSMAFSCYRAAEFNNASTYTFMLLSLVGVCRSAHFFQKEIVL